MKSEQNHLPNETEIAEQIAVHALDLEDHVMLPGTGRRRGIWCA
jgi:hypothetical protein